mgnify:FL=1
MTLAIEHLEVSYGRLAAVRDATVTVASGEIVALVGPNGAGKSTTLLAAAGALQPRGGTITLDGASLLGLSPEQRVRRDLAMVPEGREIFRTLTVAENLTVAAGAGRAKPGTAEVMDELLALFPILRERLRQPAGQLSGGEQQQLAIARALMTRPRYLLIDEPSLGLAPLVVKRVYEMLTELRRRQGLAILVVEQSMRRVLSVADKVCVMRDGRVVATFAGEDLSDRRRLEQVYFGLAD